MVYVSHPEALCLDGSRAVYYLINYERLFTLRKDSEVGKISLYSTFKVEGIFTNDYILGGLEEKRFMKRLFLRMSGHKR